MRWLSYFILAYLVIGVQWALAGFLQWHGVSPNLVLPVAVFIAINARREEALLGAFILGALQDLFTQQPPGLYAFAYGLAGLLVVSSRPVVYRDHPLTHFFMTLLAALLTGTIVLINEWAFPRLHRVVDAAPISITLMLGRAVYTALLAPLLLFGLARIKRAFGFKDTRARGMTEMATR